MKVEIIPWKWQNKVFIYNDRDEVVWESEPMNYDEALKYKKSIEITADIIKKSLNELAVGEMSCTGEVIKGG
jgi:hypothetical protein